MVFELQSAPSRELNLGLDQTEFSFSFFFFRPRLGSESVSVWPISAQIWPRSTPKPARGLPTEHRSCRGSAVKGRSVHDQLGVQAWVREW